MLFRSSVAHDLPIGAPVEVRGELPPPAEFTMPVEAPVAAFEVPIAEVAEKIETPAPLPKYRRGR